MSDCFFLPLHPEMEGREGNHSDGSRKVPSISSDAKQPESWPGASRRKVAIVGNGGTKGSGGGQGTQSQLVIVAWPL